MGGYLSSRVKTGTPNWAAWMHASTSGQMRQWGNVQWVKQAACGRKRVESFELWQWVTTGVINKYCRRSGPNKHKTSKLTRKTTCKFESYLRFVYCMPLTVQAQNPRIGSFEDQQKRHNKNECSHVYDITTLNGEIKFIW